MGWGGWAFVVIVLAVLLWIGPPLLGWLVFSAGPYLLGAAAIVFAGLMVISAADDS